MRPVPGGGLWGCWQRLCWSPPAHHGVSLSPLLARFYIFPREGGRREEEEEAVEKTLGKRMVGGGGVCVSLAVSVCV